jgi:hypothetical protein
MLEAIRQAIRDTRFNITNHADEEMESDGIFEEQLFAAILGGEIIEDYPNDVPFPSCLILGFDETHRPIHSVVAYSADQALAIMVTTYVPDPGRWIDFRIRRR